ncbi:MAG: ArsR/SmtB family transcription factor [Ferrovibrio sp.]|jgi:DNA-binding transcriptional ArsR family regulator|uniref:ArsR/SmtB family transcription factor n=1 Tax=Ferrovibrio sp. TaxID=1917215 RepID=UPI00391B04BA
MDAALLDQLSASAAQASHFLRSLANEKRLLVLCQLMEGERSVGSLAAQVDLSQSALSQHLTKLREDGLVATRRDGQTIYYRLADRRVEAIITLLYEQFCKTNC